MSDLNPIETSKDLPKDLREALVNSPETILETYPDGAVLVGGDGNVLSNNDQGSLLAEVITKSFGLKRGNELTSLINEAINGEGANLDAVNLDDDQQIDITAVPLIRGQAVLVLGRDHTFEHNMFAALIESRARYKDLVEISSDFSWELGPDGDFSFVSTGGAMGFESDDIVGQSPEKFFHMPSDSKDTTPFVRTDRCNDIEVEMKRADGGVASLLVSSLPLFDELGSWRGSRGICRDMTEHRQQRMALDEARMREILLKHLVDIIRDEVDPLKTLTGSIKYIVHASSFAGCKVFKRDEFSAKGKMFISAAEYGDNKASPPDENIIPMFESVSGTTPVAGQGWSGLLAPTGYREHINGAICVWRGAGTTDWTDGEVTLVDSVAGQLGIAIERVIQHERIVHLSWTDELTRLLNRRAFLEEELPRRMKRLVHAGQPAALFFVDLDNFKRVNDVHGHHVGDEVLIRLSRFLEKHSRPGDAVARFGGDEFAMWLDGMDVDGAKTRVELMIEDSQEFKQYSGDDDHPLGISVGVSIFDPKTDEFIEDLVRRADQTMYEVKRGGKGGFLIGS